MTFVNNSCWPERDQELRDLWEAGLSGAKIGQRMNISKNSVVGRSHRLGLPSRPSPIIHTGMPPRRSIRAQGPTLPPLTSEIRAVPGLRREPMVIAKPPVKPSVVKPPKPLPRADGNGILYTADMPANLCCFMVSVGRPWRCCGAPRVFGSPYCASHLRLASSAGSGRPYMPGVVG